MKTLVEVYLVTLVPEGFHVVTKLLDITQDVRDPDGIVNEYLMFLFRDNEIIIEKEKYILHSTSWRYEAPKNIVLTYLVYADSFSFKAVSPWIIRREDLVIAQSKNPHVPRPKKLESVAVISHGLRHLAFLIKNDDIGTYKTVLHPETVATFIEIHEKLAGRV